MVNGDCPVCLSSGVACLRLGCSHLVCADCWERWQDRTLVDADHSDEDDAEDQGADGRPLTPRAAARRRDSVTKLESTPTPQALRRMRKAAVAEYEAAQTAPVDSGALSEYIQRTVDTLLHHSAHGGAHGRAQLKRMLLILPVEVVLADAVRPYVLRRANLVAMRAYMETMAARRDCIQ
eukprot:SAG25_NODE_1462_length_2968_cov_14.097595_3_plen_179_part_00